MLGWTAAALSAMMAVGCGRHASDRYALAGSITLDQEPVNGGNIQFEPLGANKTSATGTLVRQGRYTVPRQTGLMPGKYRVRIYCAEKIDPKLVSNQTPKLRPTWNEVPHARELVPAKYNTESELVVEVRPNDTNWFDFSLSTNPAPQP